jgi:hypothetical protein
MKKQHVRTEFISQQTYVNISLKKKGTWTLERAETVTKPAGIIPLTFSTGLIKFG